jgi:cysteine-rich repeat protein
MRRSRPQRACPGAILLALLLSPQVAHASPSTAGALTFPSPTVENLSIDWAVSGDSNNNGVVSVRFRQTGTTIWRRGPALRRIPGGSWSEGGYSWANRHSGSLFDLKPGTSYEIELSLSDPDGGSKVQTATATTRPIPVAPASATTKNLSSSPSTGSPGEILLLAAGSHGGFTFSSSGQAGKPIVIRGASQSGTVVNGDVLLEGVSHVYLENLTVNGRIKLNDSKNMVIRRCKVNAGDTGGIVAYAGGTSDSYLVDNTVIGKAPWENSAVGANGFDGSEGIELAGSGNVIAYNTVKGFRDCISTMEQTSVKQVSIDIHNNDLEVCTDDAVEADFTMGNSRVVQNRIKNSFVGMSSQPGLGGPAYFIRNTMYNIIYSPFKLHRGSVGDIGYHNTVVKCGDAFACFTSDTWSRALFRNNLFIGGSGAGEYGGYSNGSGAAATLSAADSSCSFDYDGYGLSGTSFEGEIAGVSFSSFAEMVQKTTEKHATQVSLAVFATAPAFPSNPFPTRANADLRLAAGSAAVDKGVAIAGINDGFVGSAPDLGAHEAGQAVPTYGPRASDTQQSCGNGDREGSEECDDGNLKGGDGCSATCTVDEAGVAPPPPGSDGGKPPVTEGGPAPGLEAGAPGLDGGSTGPGADRLEGGCGCGLAPDGLGSTLSLLLAALLLALRRAQR